MRREGAADPLGGSFALLTMTNEVRFFLDTRLAPKDGRSVTGQPEAAASA